MHLSDVHKKIIHHLYQQRRKHVTEIIEKYEKTSQRRFNCKKKRCNLQGFGNWSSGYANCFGRLSHQIHNSKKLLKCLKWQKTHHL